MVDNENTTKTDYYNPKLAISPTNTSSDPAHSSTPYDMYLCIHIYTHTSKYVTKSISSSGAPKVVSEAGRKKSIEEAAAAAARKPVSQPWAAATSGARGAAAFLRNVRGARATTTEDGLGQGPGEQVPERNLDAEHGGTLRKLVW